MCTLLCKRKTENICLPFVRYSLISCFIFLGGRGIYARMDVYDVLCSLQEWMFLSFVLCSIGSLNLSFVLSKKRYFCSLSYTRLVVCHLFYPCLCGFPAVPSRGDGDVAQLVERGTGTLLMQVRFPSAARDFSPMVNFQCRLSYVLSLIHI